MGLKLKCKPVMIHLGYQLITSEIKTQIAGHACEEFFVIILSGKIHLKSYAPHKRTHKECLFSAFCLLDFIELHLTCFRPIPSLELKYILQDSNKD